MLPTIKFGAVAQLRTDQAAATHAFAARETELVRHLISLIPNPLKGAWLAEVGILAVRSLVEQGTYTENYGRNCSDPIDYGFKSLDEIHQAFEELRTAWAGIVNVTLEWWDETHRRLLLVFCPTPVPQPF